MSMHERTWDPAKDFARARGPGFLRLAIVRAIQMCSKNIPKSLNLPCKSEAKRRVSASVCKRRTYLWWGKDSWYRQKPLARFLSKFRRSRPCLKSSYSYHLLWFAKNRQWLAPRETSCWVHRLRWTYRIISMSGRARQQRRELVRLAPIGTGFELLRAHNETSNGACQVFGSIRSFY